jgi:hypothetical protein
MLKMLLEVMVNPPKKKPKEKKRWRVSSTWWLRQQQQHRITDKPSWVPRSKSPSRTPSNSAQRTSLSSSPTNLNPRILLTRARVRLRNS